RETSSGKCRLLELAAHTEILLIRRTTGGAWPASFGTFAEGLSARRLRPSAGWRILGRMAGKNLERAPEKRVEQRNIDVHARAVAAVVAREVPAEILAPDFRMEDPVTAVSDYTYHGGDGWREWMRDLRRGGDRRPLEDAAQLPLGRRHLVSRREGHARRRLPHAGGGPEGCGAGGAGRVAFHAPRSKNSPNSQDSLISRG